MGSRIATAGERIFNVLKMFNVRMGAVRRDDYPSRGATWPPDQSLRVDGHQYGTLDTLLSDYYAERGWHRNTGIPTRVTIESLQLQRLADGDADTT